MKNLTRLIVLILVFSFCTSSFIACNKEEWQDINSEGTSANKITNDNSAQTNSTNNETEAAETEPAIELERFWYPGVEFYHPKYAYESSRILYGKIGDQMAYFDDNVEEITAMLALDEAALKEKIRTKYPVNSLMGMEIVDISSSFSENKNGIMIYTYEFEAKVSGITMYHNYYVFEGEQFGFVLGYAYLGDKAGADELLLKTVFDTINLSSMTTG